MKNRPSLLLLPLLLSSASWALDLSDEIDVLTLPGPAGSSGFGFSLARAGDFDADGVDDIVVGAWRGGPGAAYVALGGPTPGAASIELIPRVTSAANEVFGQTVAGLGDFDGDGHPDVAVRHRTLEEVSPGNSVWISRLVVYLGGPSADGVYDLVLEPPGYVDGEFGSAVAAGDLTGDGINDLVVGAYISNGGTGRFDVLQGGPFGGAGWQPSVLFSQIGSAYPHDRLGTAAVFLPDVTGDGRPGFAVGLDTGAARVYVTLPGGGFELFRSLTGTAGGVLAAGDTNADGVTDLLVGNGVNPRSSVVALFHGGPTMSVTPTRTFTGSAYSNLGSSLALIDIDGDGRSEPALGDYTTTVPSDPNYPIQLYYGEAGIWHAGAQIPVFRDYGGFSGALLGFAMARVGDVNGDGYDDLAAGELTANQLRIYLGFRQPSTGGGRGELPDIGG